MNAKMRNPQRSPLDWKKVARRGAALPASILLLVTAWFAVAAGTGSARPAVAPTNTAPPTISGKAQAGVTLKAENGTWTGTQPLTYAYQWRICNESGGACHDISGAQGNEYTVKTADAGNTLRVVVNAKNADGTGSATSVPTGQIAAASGSTTTTTTTPTPANGCQKTGGPIAIAGVAPPARLSIDQFQVTPSSITHSTRQLSVRFHVSACGGPVQGALVFVTPVPYGMFGASNEQPTGADGWATIQLNALPGYPATPKQQLLVMFVRARKSGENLLAGVSNRRLISFRVAR